MSVTALNLSDVPTQTTARIANLEIEIRKTKNAIKGLQANGHLTEDAEKHLSRMSQDLGYLVRGMR